jgi:formate dehydrogenase major subunit
VPGLGTSFGRGAATSYQQDLENSDCILFMGSNMAEAHPVGFRWPMKAKEKGATLLHVDPRFTRTSAHCDLFVPIRAGTDVAFLGGLVNHVLNHNGWFHEYVLAFTNAAVLIDDEFRDTEDLAGLFSGYHGSGMAGSYDPEDGHWGYAHSSDDTGPSRDPTLQNPRCVMQILKRHFARYTPAMVAEVCGCTAAQLTQIADTLIANSGRARTTCIVYSLGWTQHVTGVQIIRTAGILQLLLGNIGRPGGGIMAMRGHSTIQGSTDMATLYDSLPGYLPQPRADGQHDTLDAYVEHEGLPTGYWSNFRKYIVSLLKAWYGDSAQPQNDFHFDCLPKADGDYSQLAYFDRMSRGGVEGLLLFGQNPAGGGINAGLHRAGLRQLKWLVVLDWFETESAVYWKNDPTGPPATDIGTEVFFIPAAAAPEKEGSLTNTQRLIQWHGKAMDPTGDSRSDAWFLYNLGKRLKALYADSTDPRDDAIRHLTWDYDEDEQRLLPDGTRSRIEGEPDLEKVLKEINGYTTAERKQLPGFMHLKDDGSTACGCWIYCGVYPEANRNRAKERNRTDNPLSPEWGFAWPDNRRVLYNRASADPDGKPWSEQKKLVWWDDPTKRWVGHDRPDFEPDKAPGYRPAPGATGMAAIGGDKPFIFKPDGMGWLYAPGMVKDGPLPAYYEPTESPVGNLLYPKQANSPVVREFDGPFNRIAHTPTVDYPIVATTFRLTEHYLSGPMSRFNSWLNELQPEMFVELSPELATELGITHGGWLTVETARGRIEARAMVTHRVQPLTVQGRVVHQIGLPFHWAFAGEVVGDNANDLTSLVAEANVSMHDAKSFACRVSAGRSGGKPAVPIVQPVRWPTHGPVPRTPAAAQPEGASEHGT